MSTTTRSSSTARYLLRALLLAVLVSAALAWPAHAWQAEAGLAALGAAAGVCLLGAAFARVAAGAIGGLDPSPESAALAVQAGIGARLFLTLAIAVPVLVLEPFPRIPFAVFLGVHYLAQLGLEVFVSVRELSQNHGPTGRPARASQPEGGPPTGSLATNSEDAEADSAEGRADNR